MNIVMLANNPCIFDARIRREAEALAEAGHHVTVLATKADNAPEHETVAGVAYHRVFRVREIEKNLHAEIGRAATSRSWRTRLKAISFTAGRRLITPSLRHLFGYAKAFRKAIKTLQPDVIHAHDLDTLLAGWLGARACRAKLVYDAHELETDRNLPMVGFEKHYRAFAERCLIQRADAVITVSDSIAAYLAKRYRIETPIVVLNAPATRRQTSGSDDGDLKRDLGLAPDQPLALYVGGLMPGRGIDQAIRTLPLLHDVHFAALGPRQAVTERDVMMLAQALGVWERVHLIDSIPHERLQTYIASADMSLILIQDVCLSYRFCFPNKLLESLLAGLPIVASGLVELKRMVASTGAGLIVDETDPGSIADAMSAILAEPNRYRPSHDIIRSLEASHGWQAQKQRLLHCYQQLDHQAVPHPVDRGPATAET